MSNRVKHNLIGQRFGKLLVIAPSGTAPRSGNQYWKCICDCGQTKIIRGDRLTGKPSQRSCGCINSTHGMSGHPLYKRWQRMKARCNNPNDKSYPHYGGRGIVVCARWADSFAAFLEDMGPTFRKGLELDRINNDGPYSPGNCRWATRRQQLNNTRANHLISFNGQTMNVTQWAVALGMRPGILRNRLSEGWGTERALTERIHTEYGPRCSREHD